MKREHFVAMASGLMLTILGAGSAIAVNPDKPPALIADYGKLPLAFEANDGQADARVKFLARGRGYALFLTGNSAVLTLPKATDLPRPSTFLRMQLMGANVNAAVTGAGKLAGRSNYFIGNDPQQWRTNLPNYAEVKYAGVYPGVDLVYYGNQSGQLEYDFVVAPGADTSAIRFEIAANSDDGAKGARRTPMRIAADGDLVVKVGGGEIRFHKPLVYQDVADGIAASQGKDLRTPAGHRRLSQGHFVLQASNEVRFALGPYDHSKALVIDPVLTYSTYLGGAGTVEGLGIAVDAAGDAYVTGIADTIAFPVANALQPNPGGSGDAFVTKFNPAGSALIYSTYLGGSLADWGTAIAVDAAGNAYVTGTTQSSNFPTVNPVQPTNPTFNNANAFVSKLNPTGSALVYSTYLGGATGGASGNAIAIDTSGNAYVAGLTAASDFPTVNALQTTNKTSPPSTGTGFVAKYNAAGSALIYSTYLGGSVEDLVNGIAADSGGNAYVAGQTESADFPTANAFQAACHDCPAIFNAFVSKINPAGSALVYSTFLAGSDTTIAEAIALDASGDAYVTGTTTSTDFPTVNPLQATNRGSSNVFITKFNPAGSALVYSTYLGGSGNSDDFGRGIAVDATGMAYVVGNTNTIDFPTVNPVQATNLGGVGIDTGFVANLNATGSALVYSTYLGGNSGDRAMAVAVDTSDNAYVTGWTMSADFPTTANVFQPALSGTENAFVAKFPAGAAPPPAPTVTISVAPTTITVGQSTMLTWGATNATSCTASGAWSGTQATSGTLSETPAQSGASTYTLTCTGAGGSAHASAVVTVNAAAAAPTVTISAAPVTITVGQSTMLTWDATNAASCTASGAWSGAQATSGTLTETPAQSGASTYTLTCTGAGGTVHATSVVNVAASAEVATVTILSGKAGGGGMDLWSLLSLGLLAAYRMRRLRRPALLGTLAVLAAVALLAAAAPVSAQQASPDAQFRWDQTYVGIRAGSGTYWESSRQLDADLVADGQTGTTTSIDQHRTSGVVYAGVPFYKLLSLELGVADLGMYPVGISTTSANIAQLAQTVVRKLSPAGRALTLNLAAPLDINGWLAFEPRVGLMGYQSTQEVYTPVGTYSHDREGAGIDAGFAVLLRPTRSLYIGAGLDCFDIDGRCTVLLYSAEIEYHFGR
jgi:hypothetical protein